MKCLFCSIPENPLQHTEPEDEIIAQTAHLYAKPALGQFVDGYTLIISKKHFMSFSHAGIHILEELSQFSQHLSKILTTIYKSPIIMFEHGEVDFRHPAGCCIEHAHLHLVPLMQDVHTPLIQQYEYERIVSLSQLSKYSDEDLSYLYYHSTQGEDTVFKVRSNLPCQFLRRLICDSIGQPDVWDWAAYPYTEKIISFKRVFADFVNRARFSDIDARKQLQLTATKM